MISPSSRKRLLGSRSGNVMIEFALSASMLVTLLLGTFQFGYAFYKYNALVNAVRGGTRYASMTKISNSGNASVPTAFSDAVKNVVVYGVASPGASPVPVVPGLATSNVNVAVTWDAKNVPLTVSVNITNYDIDAVVKTFTLSNKPVLAMPFFGQYCSTSC